MDELTKHLGKIRVPGRNDKVYKDECVLSFDTPVGVSIVFREFGFHQ